MSIKINELLYSSEHEFKSLENIAEQLQLNELFHMTLEQDLEEARLELHRLLYRLNLAQLSCSWGNRPSNINHPYFVTIKYKIETALESDFLKSHANEWVLINDKSFGLAELIQFIQAHPSSKLHQLDDFLKEEASLAQFKEFLFQESPLEMLFGDILAFMLPGVYGSIKMEILKNFCDELGNGKVKHIHRNLRAQLMHTIGLPEDVYISNVNAFIREELQLINLYLSMATNRSKHLRLIGVLLATELSVANHFEYQIEGWRRLGLEDRDLAYYKAHISIDDEHSQDWINKVVKPILAIDPENIRPIALGALRRLVARSAVVNKLNERIRAV